MIFERTLMHSLYSPYSICMMVVGPCVGRAAPLVFFKVPLLYSISKSGPDKPELGFVRASF